MTARNAPCPCGSGKKFKHCHGRSRSRTPHPSPGTGGLAQARAALAGRQWARAVQIAERAPAGLPRSQCLAHALIGRREPGDLERARQALHDWTRRAPRDPEPWQRLLEIDLYESRLDRAAETFTRFAAHHPPRAEAAYYAAVLQQLDDKPRSALDGYSEAIALRRRQAGLRPLDQPSLAVAAAMQMYETAAGNYPGSPARQPEGMFDQQREVDLLEARLEDWERALVGTTDHTDAEIARTHADAWYNLGCAAMAGFAGHRRAIACFERAVALCPDHLLARLNATFALNYSETASAGQIFAAHRETGRWLERRCDDGAISFANLRDVERRLRIGYLSSDFRMHSVAHFIVPVLEAHDAGQFEVIAYYTHDRDDAFTERARAACARFRQVAGLSDTALRQRIVDDGVDVLVDLNGLTQRHRMAVLAARAAPVQINWLGYPNTTGLGTVDYRIVDGVTDPPGTAEPLATETLLRIGGNFSVYEPPADAPPVGELPLLARGGLTFGCFNAMPKLNEPLLQSWAGLLERVPGARLLLKNVALGYDAPRRRLLEVFGRFGIGPDRLAFAGHSPDQRGHLEHYGQVDIALDTYPYNGTTTTCESLHMGVPVISRRGGEHRSRVGASLLRGAGLESLIATDDNTLTGIAADLASDVKRLAALRAGLRDRLGSSPLTDVAGFTHALEHALRQVWADWCSAIGEEV